MGSEKHDPVVATAVEWLLQLQANPEDAQLQAACRAWQSADPAHASAWRRAQQVWQLSAALAPSVPPLRPLPVRRSRRPWFGAALAACLVLALLPLGRAYHGDYRTGSGQTLQITLEDGTRATLGSDSVLSSRFTAAQRAVELRQGRVFFEVTPDAARPFTVDAGKTQVRVTGTAFEVQRSTARMEVAVEHGSVEVSDPRLSSAATPALLQAGDRLRIDPQTERARQDQQPSNQIAAWRYGLLIAENQPLGEVLEQLNEAYAGMILLRDPSLSQRKVTGVYNLRQPQAAIRALIKAQGAQVKAYSPWLLVISPR